MDRQEPCLMNAQSGSNMPIESPGEGLRGDLAYCGRFVDNRLGGSVEGVLLLPLVNGAT
jgi:hypothetical protein